MSKDVTERNAVRYVATLKKGNSMESDPINFAHVKIFVRPALRSIIFYSSIIVISLMTIFRHVHAEGIVISSGPAAYRFEMCNFTMTLICLPIAGDRPTLSECQALAAILPGFYPSRFKEIRAEGYSCLTTWFFFASRSLPLLQCPANSTGTSTCTCNTGFVPDPTATSCVPDNITITLSGGTTTEPWHKKHDPAHLKANLPYKAVVKDQNGQPKANFAVTITTEVTSDSGGHVHTNGRPKGKLVDQVGASVSTKAGKETITGTTNGSGIFEFTFGAEEASGTHTLTAKCDSGCQAPATATVDVGIKGLMQLDADPLGYTLTGDRPEHPDNHYFSPAATVKIINLAHRYKKEFNKQKYKNPPYIGIFKTPLVINDSSLKKGGTFDVLQDWTSLSDVHGGHRQGVVVDINGIKEESLDFEEMAEECCKITADWHPGGTGPHYHLKLLGRDQ